MPWLTWVGVVLVFFVFSIHGDNCRGLTTILKKAGYRTYPNWSVSSLYHGSIAREAILSSNNEELKASLEKQLKLIMISRYRFLASLVAVVILMTAQ